MITQMSVKSAKELMLGDMLVLDEGTWEVINVMKGMYILASTLPHVEVQLSNNMFLYYPETAMMAVA